MLVIHSNAFEKVSVCVGLGVYEAVCRYMRRCSGVSPYEYVSSCMRVGVYVCPRIGSSSASVSVRIDLITPLTSPSRLSLKPPPPPPPLLFPRKGLWAELGVPQDQRMGLMNHVASGVLKEAQQQLGQV